MNLTTDTRKARPLSPHLQIYKPQLTSVMSIMHRLTGIALTGGMVVLVAWLAALASGPEAYASFTTCAKTIVGQLVLAVISFSFFFHLCSGIRHLLWDAGMFLDLKDVYKTGRIVIATSIVLTLLVWLDVYGASL